MASKQDDIITQIDVWSVENEYGKAFTTIDYVRKYHPQYQELQLRKKNLLIKADDYEQHIDQQIQQLIKKNQWAQALDLFDQAKHKYPMGKGLSKTKKKLFRKQQEMLALIEQKIMLKRSLWMINTRPVYQEKLNTDPRNEALHKQVDSLNSEAKTLAQTLTQLAEDTINKKHYKTAMVQIEQAIALEPSPKRQQILSQLQSQEKQSYKKKKQTQNREHKIQQASIVQDIEKSLDAGDYIKARQLIFKLDENEQNNIQIIEIKQELELSINDKIQQLISVANKHYTNGQFYQAIELWEQVLMYDPQNSLAKKNIRRAQGVIDKLRSLREKQ